MPQNWKTYKLGEFIATLTDARAAIRLAVKKELKGKVPFSALDKILKEVIEQAEGQYSDWPVVG